MNTDDFTDIPRDAHAVQRWRWDSADGEELTGKWHRVMYWVTRDGIVAGVITACHCVMEPVNLRCVGEPPHASFHQANQCPECYGVPKPDPDRMTAVDDSGRQYDGRD